MPIKTKTATKTKTKTKRPTISLDQLKRLTWDAAMSQRITDELKAAAAHAISVLGTKQDDVQLAFMGAWMAAYITKKTDAPYDDELVDEAMDMKQARNVNAAKPHPEYGQRNAAWEAAYNAAKTAWSSLLAAHGLKTTKKQGGARKRTTTEATPRTVEATPVVPSTNAARDWINNEVSIVAAFAERNAGTLTSTMLQALENAVVSLKAALATE